MSDESTQHALEYFSPRRLPRQRWHVPPAVLNTFDLVVTALLCSQISFLLAMMAINIRECGIPPYGWGSSYNSSALGNDDFVRTLPGLSATLASADRHWMEPYYTPAFLVNAFTMTGASWMMAGYLIWRTFRTRGFRRIVTAFLALLMCATLPWIWGALMVRFD